MRWFKKKISTAELRKNWNEGYRGDPKTRKKAVEDALTESLLEIINTPEEQSTLKTAATIEVEKRRERLSLRNYRTAIITLLLAIIALAIQCPFFYKRNSSYVCQKQQIAKVTIVLTEKGIFSKECEILTGGENDMPFNDNTPLTHSQNCENQLKSLVSTGFDCKKSNLWN